MKLTLALCGAALASLLLPIHAFAQTTSISYQGRLLDRGSPANGSYDLTFALYGAATGGSPSGILLTNHSVAASNGLVTTVLNFGASPFGGGALWLEVGLRPAGIAGAFTTLAPRQPLTPVPYALTAQAIAGPVGSGSLAGNYGNALVFNNAANQFSGAFSGNGTALLNVNAASVGGLTPTGIWQVGGNAGLRDTNAGVLGTIDNLPLELHVHGDRAWRIEPGADGNPNLLGGSSNNVAGANVTGAVIGGGDLNTIAAGSYNSVIGGGARNLIDAGAFESVVGGGLGNSVAADANDSTVGGGVFNSITAQSATVGGGEYNAAAGFAATVPGGSGNSAGGDYSLAAGNGATAAHAGAFVWSDAAGYPFASTTENEFAVRATGGVRFVSATDTNAVPIAGVELAAGAGAWSTLSDRGSKEHFASVDPRLILQQVESLPISTWNYRSQAPRVRHLGPMAQDFARTFGVGEDDRHISTVDADGVALAAIQGLTLRLHEKEAEIAQLKQRLDRLERAWSHHSDRP